MSVRNETEPGGEIVCIQEFSARPRGQDRESTKAMRRTFRVGERVRYVESYFKETPEDNPTGYMIVFEPLRSKDGPRYDAVETNFVTPECCEGLKTYFATRFSLQVNRSGAVAAGSDAAL